MELSNENEPLSHYNLLKSKDVDFSETVVSRLYCDHSLIPVNGSKVDARLNAVEGTKFNFGYLTYGVDAKIVLPPLPPCYHVNITLAGKSHVKRKEDETAITQGMRSGTVLLPDQKATVFWASDTKQYAFKFPQEKLENHLSSLICERVDGPINFDITFDLQNSAGRSLLRACTLLQSEWEEQTTIALSPIARRHIESLVLTNFLLTAKSSFSEKLLGGSNNKSSCSKLVCRVKNYIEDNIHELPELADLTAYAEVSARSLQFGFKRHLGVSPMEYVRNIRLQHAHEQLIIANFTGDNVTDIAMRWGFYNTGRFSQLYKARYGCSPRSTLLKS